MSKNADLAKEAGNPGSEPEDYVVTGIELMEVSVLYHSIREIIFKPVLFRTQLIMVTQMP